MPTSFSTKAAFLCIFNTLLSILLLAISCVFAQVQYDPSHCALSSDFAACIVPPPDTDGDVACLQSLTDAITEYQLRSNDAPGTALYLQRNLTITRQVNFETTTLEVIVFGCGHVVTCEGKVGSDGRPRQTGINIYGGISNTMGQNSFAETGGVQFADLTLTGCNKGIWVLLPTSASLTLLENVHITKCSQSTGGNGGAVYTVGKLTVLNSTFDLNEARDQGGALYSKNHMTVVNSVFQENAAGGRGGACFSEGVMEVDNSTFEHNVAQLGGAIYGKDVSMVARSRFEFNVAGQDQGLNNDVHSGSGGAIFGYGDGDIQNCTFMNNTASRYGGALRYLGNLSVNDTGFFNNTISFVTNDLDVLGGAIRVFWSLIVIGSTFIDNSVRDDGGAVFCENRVYAQDCQFLNNVAGQSGGAIRARFVETVGGTFDNNTARDGGAMYSTKVVELQATSFSHNVATTAGGAVFLGDGGHLEACTFKANIASIGAAVNSIGLKLTVRNSVMKQNSAPQQGFVTAIMNHGQGTLELTNTSILDNTAFDIGLVNSIDLLMVDCLVSGNVVTGNGPHISASHYVR
ncbi:hypothetical protein SARC_01746 [Sphaeroforma arctica JP610]|uniref:Right handed beta helix domain-containing protein n=1 Tax=Sphaeroforma arctica JP610 TaxID=667725 RepID=A0A0L0GAQ7_9EUKA|nr:hypothetical protein SARC_01746 [Sphaeroforma arctica JP610]KNC86087.1 hypothetical protein SARC_01746 [Sphaeroforma arctica JP610]|eukprot:XP_014159989.1 hypothetical protein SARC_01746 [Sphaeroforma arctica JP610]